MIKLTQKKLIEVIKEKSGIDVVYIGRFSDNNYERSVTGKMAFLNKHNNKLMSLSEDKLYDLLK